jgi:hypothetical protein
LTGGLIFYLCSVLLVQNFSAWDFSGNAEATWYGGKEEVFLPEGNGGLKKQERNTDYLRYTGWASLFVPRKMGRLDLSFSNDLDGDVYSDVSLASPQIDSSQQTRFSNWLNSTNLQAIWPMSSKIRLKGSAGMEVFRDDSFPEYSADEKTAILEIERLLRENVYLTFGYQAQSVDFISAPLEDYYQRDLYASFYRYSPAKYRVERREFTESYIHNPLGSHFDENSIRLMEQDGFFHSRFSLENTRSIHVQKPRYYQIRTQSDMIFELEGRLRHRDLYNDLERSYLEGQLNAVVRFFFREGHYLQLNNSYSDREYAKESAPDIIHSYQRNLFEFAHVLSSGGFSADSRASYDKYFHKDDVSNDYAVFSLQSSLGWDIIRQWNMSWFGLFKQADYDEPRVYFADYRQVLNSISLTWRFNDGFALTTSREDETKEVEQFESILDASFKRESMDFRLKWQGGGPLSYHAGWRFDEKKHTVLDDYDRYEELVYGGTNVSF